MQEVVVFMGTPNKMELEDFRDCISVVGIPYNRLFEALKPYSLQCAKEIKLYRSSGYNNPEDEKQYINEIQKIRQWAQININGIQKNEEPYIENTFKNIKNNPIPIKLLKGKINKPCVIVGAGPSLDKNINILKENQNKVFIIATAQVQNKLYLNNIKPDIVTSIDPYVINWQHFKDIKYYPPICINSGCWHEILRDWKGLKFMSIDNKPIKNSIGIDYGEIECGMCISHYSYNLAQYLGCSEIILIGQDLALNDGKYYADGLPERKKKKGNFNIKGYYGDEVETTQQLFAYKNLFESYFNNADNTIYNCTEGGAFIEGAIHNPLNEVLSNLKEIEMFVDFDKLKDEKDDNKRNKIILSFKDEKTKEIKMFKDELENILLSHEKMVAFFNNNMFDKGLEELKKAAVLEKIIEKNIVLMESIKHLVIKIYMKKPIDEKELIESINKKNSRKMVEFIKDETNTVRTILNALDFLKENMEKL